MQVRALPVLAILAVAGCGGNEREPDTADSVLSRADAAEVEGASEGVDAVCSGAGDNDLRHSSLQTLERIATRSPHAAVPDGEPELTMIQHLELLEDSYPDCGVAKDLGDVADELRNQP